MLLSTVALVTGGTASAVLSVQTAVAAAGALATIADTGKVTDSMRLTLGNAAHNIMSNILGDVAPEHAANNQTADVATQKIVVDQAQDAVVRILKSLFVEGQKTAAPAAPGGKAFSVSTSSADGALQAATEQSTCRATSPHTHAFGNLSVDLGPSWLQCVVGQRARRSGQSAVVTSLGTSSSPYRWISPGPTGSTVSIGIAGDSGASSSTECNELTITSKRQPTYTQVKTITKRTPLVLSFDRTQASLLKSLHFIVEPYHRGATGADMEKQSVGAYLRTQPALTVLDVDEVKGVKKWQFNASWYPESKRFALGTGEAHSDIAHLGHVLQLVPVLEGTKPCKDGTSGQYRNTTQTFAEGSVPYMLVVHTNSSDPVQVRVTMFEVECLFKDVAAGASWDNRRCTAIASTSQDALKCTCNAVLGALGGAYSMPAVKQDTIPVNYIVDTDFITDNIVVFFVLCATWLVFMLLLIVSNQEDKQVAEVSTEPVFVHRALPVDKAHVTPSRYRVTVKMGPRPDGGVPVHGKLVLELKSKSKERDEINLGSTTDLEAYKALQKNNTADFYVISSIQKFSDINDVTVKLVMDTRAAEQVMGSNGEITTTKKAKDRDGYCHVSYVIIQDLKVQESGATLKRIAPKYCWFNDWITSNLPITTTPLSFKAFNSLEYLLQYYWNEIIAEAHFIWSLFAMPPWTKYTSLERTWVLLGALLGIMAGSARNFDVDFTWEEAVTCGSVVGIVVSLIAGAIAMPFRVIGKDNRRCSLRSLGLKVLVLGILALNIFATNETLEATYDWETIELSFKWLVSVVCGLAAASIAECIYAFCVALVFTQLYTLAASKVEAADMPTTKPTLADADGNTVKPPKPGQPQPGPPGPPGHFYPSGGPFGGPGYGGGPPPGLGMPFGPHGFGGPPLSPGMLQPPGLAGMQGVYDNQFGNGSERSFGLVRPEGYEEALLRARMASMPVQPEDMPSGNFNEFVDAMRTPDPSEDAMSESSFGSLGSAVAGASNEVDAAVMAVLGEVGKRSNFNRQASARFAGSVGARRSTRKASARKGAASYAPSVLQPNTAAAWFFGDVTRQEAESALQGQPDGTYVIRDSSYAGDYSLSVSCLGNVHNYRIQNIDGRFTIDEDVLFGDVPSMIAHYEKDSDGLATRLTTPLQPNASAAGAGELDSAAGGGRWFDEPAGGGEDEWTTVQNALAPEEGYLNLGGSVRH